MTCKTVTAVSVVLGLGAGTALADCDIGGGKTITSVEPTSTVEKFFYNISYRALERIGYKVGVPEEVDYVTMHVAVATGDADFAASHWNVLHKDMFEEAGGDSRMTKVGELVSGAVQGYLVDKKSYDAGIHDLADLADKEVAERFDTDGDGKADLVGCGPGWGCEAVIERHLDKIGLRDTVNHVQGAYDALMIDVIARHHIGEPVLYFTWIPYWVPAELVPGRDVEWISVPRIEGDEALFTDYEGKNLGFGRDYTSFIVNNDFLAENPAVGELFKAMHVDIADVSAEAGRQQKGENSVEEVRRHADEWVAAHQEDVDRWVEAACVAP